MQERVIEQYTDPFTASTQSDTLLQSFPVEFKNDGNFFTNGEQMGTYSILGDSSFSLKPVGNIAIVNIYGTYNIIAIGNGILKTRRAGGNGEQIKIFNPDMQGMFAYAHIQYVFTEYQKQ